jgi:hypothetical protein
MVEQQQATTGVLAAMAEKLGIGNNKEWTNWG